MVKLFRSNIFLFITGIFSFAILIGSRGTLKWLAILSIGLCSYAVYREVLMYGQAKTIWGENKNEGWRYGMMGLSLAMGLGVGIVYRMSIGTTMVPGSYTWFTVIAAAIGATEEILFRGVLFYLLKKQSVFMIVLVSSLAHAGYKTILFISPFATQSVDYMQLFTYTFLAGLVMGSIRILSASTAPPLVAHASWDIIVYGDQAEAPWWVW